MAHEIVINLIVKGSGKAASEIKTINVVLKRQADEATAIAKEARAQQVLQLKIRAQAERELTAELNRQLKLRAAAERKELADKRLRLQMRAQAQRELTAEQNMQMKLRMAAEKIHTEEVTRQLKIQSAAERKEAADARLRMQVRAQAERELTAEQNRQIKLRAAAERIFTAEQNRELKARAAAEKSLTTYETMQMRLRAAAHKEEMAEKSFNLKAYTAMQRQALAEQRLAHTIQQAEERKATAERARQLKLQLAAEKAAEAERARMVKRNAALIAMTPQAYRVRNAAFLSAFRSQMSLQQRYHRLLLAGQMQYNITSKFLAQQWASFMRSPMVRFISFLTTDFLGALKKVGMAAAVIYGGMAFAAGVAINKIARGVLKASEEFEKFEITLTGALGPRKARDLAEFAEVFATLSPATMEDIRSAIRSIALIPSTQIKLLEGTKEETEAVVKDLTNTILGLAAINPQQGVQGAAFALREALGGRLRSLAFRFDVLPSVVAGSIGKTVEELREGGDLALEAVKGFVDKFVGTETISKLGRLPTILLGNIKDAFQMAYRRVGDFGFYDTVTTKLRESSDKMIAFVQTGFITEGHAKRISDAMKRITDALSGIGGGLLDRLFGGEGGRGTRIASAVARMLEKTADVLENRIQPWLDTNSDKIGNFAAKTLAMFQMLIDRVGGMLSALGGLNGALKYGGALLAMWFLKMTLMVDILRILSHGATALKEAFNVLRYTVASIAVSLAGDLYVGFLRVEKTVKSVWHILKAGFTGSLEFLREVARDIAEWFEVAWFNVRRVILQAKILYLDQKQKQEQFGAGSLFSGDKGRATREEMYRAEDELKKLDSKLSDIRTRQARDEIARAAERDAKLKKMAEDHAVEMALIDERIAATESKVGDKRFEYRMKAMEASDRWIEAAGKAKDAFDEAATIDLIEYIRSYLTELDKLPDKLDQAAEAQKRFFAALLTAAELRNRGAFSADELFDIVRQEFIRAGGGAERATLEKSALEIEEAFGKKFKDVFAEEMDSISKFSDMASTAQKKLNVQYMKAVAELRDAGVSQSQLNELSKAYSVILASIHENLASIKGMKISKILNEALGKGTAAFQGNIIEAAVGTGVPLTGMGFSAPELGEKIRKGLEDRDGAMQRFHEREADRDDATVQEKIATQDLLKKMEIDRILYVRDRVKWGADEQVHINQWAAEQMMLVNEEYADRFRSLTEDEVFNFKEAWIGAVYSIRDAFRDNLSDGIFKVLKGDIKGLMDVLQSFGDAVLKQLTDMAAQWATMSLFGMGGTKNLLPGLMGVFTGLGGGGGGGAAALQALPNYTHMPFFGAEGAIVSKPTLALIGEAGPEILKPLHTAPGASPIPKGEAPSQPIQIVNVLDPADIVARGIGNNPNVVLNVVHKDIARKGQSTKLARRGGR